MKDPVLWLIKNLILRKFQCAELTTDEAAFIDANAKKHRNALWATIVAMVPFILGLQEVKSDEMGTIVTGLIAPVMVLGGAWFAISFGGVPVKLMDIAMEITSWMFTAFSASFAAMFVTVGFITSPFIWPLLAVVYVGAMVSCIQYDTTDGLKAGLDDVVLRASRAHLLYYKKSQGIDPDKDVMD